MAMSCGNSCLVAAWRQANRLGKGVRAILRSLGKTLIVCAATASVISMAAAPALAAATWTVKPGGTTKATAASAVVTDSTHGLSVTCTSSVAKGTLKSGSGLAATGLGTITSIAFNGCAVGTITVAVKITGTMPLNGVTYVSATKTANMTITKIHGTFTVSAISCTATVDGTSAIAHNGMVAATFNNSTHKLTVLATGGNLHLYNVSTGCATGGVANGDGVNWTGSYLTSPKQTITSP
jgi:hypothetical protein